jgi:hypothetical protein
MSIPFSQEQLELRDTVRAFFDSVYPQTSFVQSVGKTERDPALWAELEKLGFIEAFDSNLGQAWAESEFSIIAHEIGRSLLPESILDSIFVRGFLSGSIGAELLGIKSSAPLILVPGNLVTESGADVLITGLNSFRPDDLLVILNFDLSRLEIVPNSAIMVLGLNQGIELLRPAASVIFCALDRKVITVGSDDWSRILALYYLLVASQLAGIAERVFEMTLEYSQVRKQFGSAIGSFQALQHRLADMYLCVQALNAACRFAAVSASQAKEQFCFSALSAMTFAIKHVPALVEGAVQVHGGIGFTWEHPLHFYLRRAQSLTLSSELHVGKMISTALEIRR